MSDLSDFERMTIREYSIRMTACALQRLDKLELVHYQAWANWQVQSTKKQGKKEVPVYKKFDKFFDKKELEDTILGKKKTTEIGKVDTKLIELLKKSNHQ